MSEKAGPVAVTWVFSTPPPFPLLPPIRSVPGYRPPCQHRISTGPGGLCSGGDRRSINQAYADAPSTHTHYVHGPTRISTTTTATTTTATATTACLATAAVCCFRGRVRSVRRLWLFNKYINIYLCTILLPYCNRETSKRITALNTDCDTAGTDLESSSPSLKISSSTWFDITYNSYTVVNAPSKYKIETEPVSWGAEYHEVIFTRCTPPVPRPPVKLRDSATPWGRSQP